MIVISPRIVSSSPPPISLEAKLGVALDVEELGRLEVRREVLVLDVDARDLGRPGQPRVGEGGVDLAELAAERAAHVGDLEADRGMNRVEVPGAGRQGLANLGRSHCCATSLSPL